MAPQPVTEIAVIPLVPGLDLESGDHKTTLDEVLSAISSQEGCQKVFWGRQRENPDILEIAADWNTIDDHIKFTKAPEYGPFMKSFQSLITAPPTINHFKISPTQPFAAPASAGITEICNLYFEDSYPSEKIKQNLQKVSEIIREKEKTVHALAGGFAVEEVAHESLGEGIKGKLYRIFIGWDSYEAHMAFRETDVLTEIRPLLREGVKGMNMFHVKYNKY